MLDECADPLGIAADDILRLQLIVEELFTNTIAHGHGGDSDLPVSISLWRDPAKLHLRYVDAAPAFDPFELRPNLPSTAAIGGFGIELIRGISREFTYTYRDGHNVIDVWL